MAEQEQASVSLKQLADEISSRFSTDQVFAQRALLALTVDPDVVAERMQVALDPDSAWRVKDAHAMDPETARQLAEDLLDGRRAVPDGLKVQPHDPSRSHKEGA